MENLDTYGISSSALDLWGYLLFPLLQAVLCILLSVPTDPDHHMKIIYGQLNTGLSISTTLMHEYNHREAAGIFSILFHTGFPQGH